MLKGRLCLLIGRSGFELFAVIPTAGDTVAAESGSIDFIVLVVLVLLLFALAIPLTMFG